MHKNLELKPTAKEPRDGFDAIEDNVFAFLTNKYHIRAAQFDWSKVMLRDLPELHNELLNLMEAAIYRRQKRRNEKVIIWVKRHFKRVVHLVGSDATHLPAIFDGLLLIHFQLKMEQLKDNSLVTYSSHFIAMVGATKDLLAANDVMPRVSVLLFGISNESLLKNENIVSYCSIVE